MSPRRAVLVDTSVAVALVVADHDAHVDVVRRLRGSRLGLSGHAWFETFSVLTRLPAPLRRPPAEVSRLLGHEFPATRFLSYATKVVAGRLAGLGIGGGSVYDALVAAVAVEADLPLLSRDRRAADVYSALGADYELLS